ncbi:Protein kinase domain-containing protein [Aphelenchoides fujianensis]|nr:Protein kinase domain-containing protein [Aphelenchoides fujianensis]
MPTETTNAVAAERLDRLPVTGDVVRSESNRVYSLKNVLGEGGYGTVFEAQDDASRTFALKAEKWSKTVLKVEISVLKATGAARCQHFCQLSDFGRVPNEYMFIVVSLLGPDLAKLRNEQPDRHFSLHTAELKQNARAAGRADFLNACPKQFDQLLGAIDRLTFDAAPPYAQIMQLLTECCAENGVQMGQKYDWETETSSVHTSVTRSIDKTPSDQHRANNVDRPTNINGT